MATVGFDIMLVKRVGADLTAWLDIGKVLNSTPPEVKKDVVDATHSKSPGKFKEYISGWRNAGEVSIDILYDGAADLVPLVADVVADDPFDYRFEFPDGSFWDFTAFATGVAPQGPIDDKLAATLTFTVTGEPDFVTV